MQIASGSIISVNPLEEIPTQNAVIGMLIQYRYGGVIMNGSKLGMNFPLWKKMEATQNDFRWH